MGFSTPWTDSGTVERVERHTERSATTFDRWLTEELRAELRTQLRDTLYTNPEARSLLHLVVYPPATAVPRAARMRDKDAEATREKKERPSNDTEPTDEERREQLDLRQQKLVLSARPRVHDIAVYVRSRYGGDVDELDQIGIVTAIELAHRYIEALASFATFVSPYARHAMIYSRKVVSKWRRRIVGSIADHLSRDGDDEEALGHMTDAIATSEILGLVDEAWPADRQMMRIELLQALRASRAELTPEEGELIRLYYDEGKDLLALVDNTKKGQSHRTLKRRHHDALVKMNGHLRELGVAV